MFVLIRKESQVVNHLGFSFCKVIMVMTNLIISLQKSLMLLIVLISFVLIILLLISILILRILLKKQNQKWRWPHILSLIIILFGGFSAIRILLGLLLSNLYQIYVILKKYSPDYNPLVSIIIPAFNEEKMIASCVTSALTQKYS